MFPYNLPKDDFTVVGWMPERLATTYLNGSNRLHEFGNLDLHPNHAEPEIVKYHKTNCLCIQGHPEMMLDNEEFISKINGIITKYLLER
jgi:hypothetical protein